VSRLIRSAEPAARPLGAVLPGLVLFAGVVKVCTAPLPVPWALPATSCTV